MILDNVIPYINATSERRCNKNYHIPDRTINDNQFLLVGGGSGTCYIEDKAFSAEKGKLFYFYPGLVHSIVSCNDDPLHMFSVHFEFDVVNMVDGKRVYEKSDSILPMHYVNSVSNVHKCSELLRNLQFIWISKRLGYELKCRSLLMEFIFEVSNQPECIGKKYINKQKIEKAIDYMLLNYKSDISLEELSILVKLTPVYFSTIFKQYTGQPPINYLNRIRLDIAKDLLLNSDYKIKDIAFMVGFNDEFYFSKMFKKYEGVNPKEYVSKL